MTSLPSYELVSRGFGFPVPRQYYEFLELAFQLNPTNPWNAFEPLSICYLDATCANPDYSYPGHDYADTPVEIDVIGWSGTDGVHYGFVVDDIPLSPRELPIAEVYPGSGCRLLGMNIAEFIGVLIAEVINDEGEAWRQENRELIMRLADALKLSVPRDIEGHLSRMRMQRAGAGAVVTLDGCGAILPREQIDWRAWEAIEWNEHPPYGKVPDHLLCEAEQRMARGDYFTAFLIARNFRHLYWHVDFKGARAYIQRTCTILERVYAMLGREHLAKKIRAQTEWAVKEVR